MLVCSRLPSLDAVVVLFFSGFYNNTWMELEKQIVCYDRTLELF